MSQFKLEHRDEGQDKIVMVAGAIDEDAQFAPVDIASSNRLVIDLEKVEAINSCGIREWITWIRKFPTEKAIVFRNCPKLVVDQINMVSGFLPDQGKVESFFVPYYCESTGNEKMILFKEGEHFNGNELNEPEEVKDDESGEIMEMDVIEAKYFKFLER